LVDVLRFHEISESSHLIMNPLSSSKLDLLGKICGLDARSRVLDLACGKGALLARFAERWGSSGVGVDIHPAFLQAAREHASTLGVSEQVSLVEADAKEADAVEGVFEVVSCLGASWIGAGATGTLTLMSRWLAPGGWLLFGDRAD
jgi:ubiquinone/menaquinone biosynthesis C-methylase UbiE